MKEILTSNKFEFEVNLTLDHPRVKRYLKVGNLQAMESKINQGLDMANSLVEPRGIYRIKKSDKREMEQYDVPEPLHWTDYLAFGVSTIGHPISDKVDELMEDGKYSLSNILDSIGSAAVDITSDRLGENIISAAHSHNLNTTRAFQPGSGSTNWKVNNQRFVFTNLNGSKIGVNLTSSFTMLPKKSNSLVIGLDEDIDQVEHLFSCAGCTRADCPARDVPKG